MDIENLEKRQLLSATLTGGGKLNVNGTATNDHVTLTVSGANIVVAFTGGSTSTQSFSAASITAGIDVSLGDGDDTFNEAAGITKDTTLHGGDGNDNVVLGAGNDEFFGEAGNDTVDGGAGQDYMNGGTNNDTVDYSKRTAAITVTYNNNFDDGTILANGFTEGDYIDDTIDTVLGGSGNDIISAFADTFNPRAYYGNGGNDTIVGGNDDDRLNGGSGTDSLDGGPGADTLVGIGDDDTLRGGNGIDSLDFYAVTGGNLYINADGIAHSGYVGRHSLIGTDVENLKGGQKNDTIIGTNGPNQLYGASGNDSILGLGGDDYINTSGGNDTIDAGNGNDTIHGGPGADSIIGNLGRDAVYGEAGNDRIRTNGDNAIDTIFGSEVGDSITKDSNDVLG